MDRVANLSRLLDWNVQRRPDAEALVDVDTGVRLTYAELRERVAAVAAGLRAQGLGRGDVVALLGYNGGDYVVVLLALSAVGAITAPLNFRLHAEELGWIVRHVGARGLIADSALRPNLSDEDAQSIELEWSLAGDPWPGATAIEALADSHAGAELVLEPVGMDDVQRVLYTSGTTSRPKGVMITHGMVLWNHLAQIVELDLREDERVLTTTPLFHVSALDGPGLSVFATGGALVVTAVTDPVRLLEIMERERITGTIPAGVTAAGMLAAAAGSALDLSAIRWMVFGGLPRDVLFGLHDRVVPQARLIQALGMTEATSGVVYVDRAHMLSKWDSCGLPMIHLDIRVVGDDGTEVAPGELGELAVRGPKVSPGYWRDPEATAAAWRDGWYHSGDIVRRDAEGYLYFVDRKKDMIKSGGENVASAEIERVLLEHPGVAQAVVVAVPDERWGEVPYAAIVPAAEDLEAQELGRYCRGRLAGYKVPKHFRFVGELPRNASGKVLKRDVRESAAAEIGALQSAAQ